MRGNGTRGPAPRRGIPGLVGATVALLGCTLMACQNSGHAYPDGQALATNPLHWRAWQGQTQALVEQQLGPATLKGTAGNLALWRYDVRWVVGTRGERYRIAQDHYPIKGATHQQDRAPAFNARLEQCRWLFTFNADALVVQVEPEGSPCPLPPPVPVPSL